VEWLVATLVLVAAAVWLGRRLDRLRAAPETAGSDADRLAPVAIGDELDLHGVPGREVAGFVDEFLSQAQARGLRSVTIVHGRGAGVLRRRVRALLSERPGVERYADAVGRAGGATAVWLLPLAGRPDADLR
jgi:DNA-nicking Smr family endonuclease